MFWIFKVAVCVVLPEVRGLILPKVYSCLRIAYGLGTCLTGGIIFYYLTFADVGITLFERSYQVALTQEWADAITGSVNRYRRLIVLKC